MDEEKQNDGIIKKTGDALKKGAKDQAKKAAQKVIKKIIAAIAPFVLKAMAIALIAVIITTVFAYILDIIKGGASKEANAFAVKYTSSAGGTASGEYTEESSLSNIIVDVTNKTENGAYILTYEFKDENGNLYSETDALENIKRDLLEKNEDLDLNQFSNSELKIIGSLMYNGLMVEDYNEEGLKALVIFVKADIASQSFDLRGEGEIGKEVDVSEIAENDFVYGTLQVHRTKANENSNGEVMYTSNGEVMYTKEALVYISYEEFSNMVDNKNIDVINKFSIDEEGNLVVAKWSTSTVTYTYQDENKKNIDIEKIPKEHAKENSNETYISSTPIKYKQYISQYTTSYGLLSDLLVVTDNVNFCLELAQLAFDSKIVINIKEELTTTTTTTVSNYTQTTLLYDYVKYVVSGGKEDIKSHTEPIMVNTGKPSDSEILHETYGWSSSLEPIQIVEDETLGEKVEIYDWVYNDKNYVLIYLTSTLKWGLSQKIIDETTHIDFPVERNVNENGDLINLNGNHVTEKYDDYIIDEDYTDSKIFKYTVTTVTNTKSNKYKFEISEIDCWYAKYEKEYTNPEEKTSNSGSDKPAIIKGQYPKGATEVTGVSINNDQHVKDFITVRKRQYQQAYPEAEDIECTVTSLNVKEKSKTDCSETITSTTKTYEFIEEEADTTEVDYKNIEYVNGPVYTNKDGSGFLYIYDKYRKDGVDLYLQDDAEKILFKLLESSTETSGASNIIKYLLYIYDGVDRGVTDLKLVLIDLNSMNSVKGSSTENYIKAWENSSLWLYETGQSTVFPSSYLTEDGAYYIVYEDGSNGHNNIAYGWATFITDSNNVKVNHTEYGGGYYNHVNYFSSAGIDVKTLHEGAHVDKNAADAAFQNGILKYFEDYVENYITTNLSSYEFSQPQKDALIAIAYQYGNISGFSDAYKSCLNKDGTINADKLREEYSRFNYSGTVNDRKYANWLLFTQEEYIDRSGNKIAVGSGSIVGAAYEVADHFMNSGVDVHYAGNDVQGSDNNGRSCIYYNIQDSWDLPIENPSKHGVVCATFVSLSIWHAGLVDEDTMNSYNYNSCESLMNVFTKSKYATEWVQINSWDELQEGDIVFVEGHVFIYIDGGLCLDQAYCVIKSNGTDNRGNLTNASYYRNTFNCAFRYIG